MFSILTAPLLRISGLKSWEVLICYPDKYLLVVYHTGLFDCSIPTSYDTVKWATPQQTRQWDLPLTDLVFYKTFFKTIHAPWSNNKACAIYHKFPPFFQGICTHILTVQNICSTPECETCGWSKPCYKMWTPANSSVREDCSGFPNFILRYNFMNEKFNLKTCGKNMSGIQYTIKNIHHTQTSV